MGLRRLWVICWLTCLGCHSIVLPDTGSDPELAASLWQQGQVAMQAGEADTAIGFYEQSLAADPSATRSHLSLAAAYLEKGNETSACAQLEKYLQAHPEHHQVRMHYAELLVRLERTTEAKDEFRRFIAEAQERGNSTLGQRIHCHSRLMQLAQDEDDDYGIHLHRGIGLYLLALERAKLADPQGQLSVESLLCRAAGDLSVAHARQPEQAQPCWYLCQVWAALGQQQLTLRWLRRTEGAAPFTPLTPAEQRQLELVCRKQQPLSLRP
jgi:tetratricopeptide (TPR) repeat protein